MPIKKDEIISLFIKLFYAMCGYFIVRYAYERIYAIYQSSTVFWIGVAGLIYLAWKFKIKLPYTLSK